MRRKKLHRRWWALWAGVIVLLVTGTLLSGEVIGVWLGTVMFSKESSDPFKFGQYAYEPGSGKARGREGVSHGQSKLNFASGDGNPQPITSQELARNPVLKKRYSAGTERDAIGIQEALFADKEVRIPPGDYFINIPLRIRSGQEIRGPGARLIGTGAMTSGVILTEGVSDVKILGLTFVNLGMTFKNSKNIEISRVVFAHDVKGRAGGAQLSFKSVSGNSFVENSRFLRQRNSKGLGLFLQRTNNVQIKNNFFMGRYEDGISVVGVCPGTGACNVGTREEPKYELKHANRELRIEKNKIRRNGPGSKEGFGINVWGAHAVALKSNLIHGWPLGKRSGCIKVGNSQDVQVVENRCDAGIYIAHDRMHPKYLRQITVKANTIKISSEIIPVDWPREYRRWLKGSPQRVAAEYSGIIVQRNFDANTLVNENIEREISVRENNVSNGMIRSKGIILGALTISENQAALCRWSKNIRSNENNRCVTQEFESP